MQNVTFANKFLNQNMETLVDLEDIKYLINEFFVSVIRSQFFLAKVQICHKDI